MTTAAQEKMDEATYTKFLTGADVVKCLDEAGKTGLPTAIDEGIRAADLAACQKLISDATTVALQCGVVQKPTRDCKSNTDCIDNDVTKGLGNDFCCNTWTIDTVPANPKWGGLSKIWGGDWNMKKGTSFSTCVSKAYAEAVIKDGSQPNDNMSDLELFFGNSPAIKAATEEAMKMNAGTLTADNFV